MFRSHDAVTFDLATLRERLARLSARGVWVGTSSWKYPGWCGLVYDESRYRYRGKFAKSRFEDHCLGEYAETFSTVCVDAAYYQFPSRGYLEKLFAEVPSEFQFSFKVTDAITVKRFPNLPRFGAMGGCANPNFLNADLFAAQFLHPCEPWRSQVGSLIFEFSRFYPSDYSHGREFVAELDTFLGALPKGWPYAVEIRNRAWLKADYFAMLTRHQVAHVWNSWQAMPSVEEQLAQPESRTAADLRVARLLLTPGRSYAKAVEAFQPYRELKEPNPSVRRAGRAILQEGLRAGPRTRTFVYVNNRLEGSAPSTIAAMVEELEGV